MRIKAEKTPAETPRGVGCGCCRRWVGADAHVGNKGFARDPAPDTESSHRPGAGVHRVRGGAERGFVRVGMTDGENSIVVVFRLMDKPSLF